MLVDFHMHSTFSDGVETPQSLLQHAMEHNISIMALTDHDEIDGIDELLSQPSIVKIITGCEFSGHYKGKDIHILGYNFDRRHRELCEFIDFFKNKRKSRIIEIINRCNEHGYHISFEELQKLYPHTKAYGRPHVAQLLINHGYATDVQTVFSTILSSKSPCYVPKVKLSVPEIIDIIHNANGLAIMAHPKLINNDTYVEELLEFDFDGVEVYHSKHTKDDIDKYLTLANQRSLVVTGGSDYHGIPNRYPHFLGEFTVRSEQLTDFLGRISENI